MATEQVTKTTDAIARGENGSEATLSVENYEGEDVAIHLRTYEDEGGIPAASVYLSPVDAVIHAERLIAAAREITTQPKED